MFHFVYVHVVSFKRLEGPSGVEFFVSTVLFRWTLSDDGDGLPIIKLD